MGICYSAVRSWYAMFNYSIVRVQEVEYNDLVFNIAKWDRRIANLVNCTPSALNSKLRLPPCSSCKRSPQVSSAWALELSYSLASSLKPSVFLPLSCLPLLLSTMQNKPPLCHALIWLPRKPRTLSPVPINFCSLRLPNRGGRMKWSPISSNWLKPWLISPCSWNNN